MIAIRAGAALVGLLSVAAGANAIVTTTGGYGTAQSYVTLAMSAGAVMGAIAVTSAAGHGRTILAVVLGVCLLAGEGYALIGTAERVVIAREAVQAPLREAAARHRAALEELVAAEAAKPAPASIERLRTAEATKAAAEAAAISKAAERDCRSNCAALLQTAAEAATREVNAARAEIAAHDTEQARLIAQRISKAKAAFEAAPMPASATPLADRVGVSPWVLDLLQAALVSIGLNGLGAVLVAFAVHAPHVKAADPVKREAEPAQLAVDPVKPAVEIVKQVANNVVALPAPMPGPVSRFMADRIEAAPRSRVEVAELFAAYGAWCAANGHPALSMANFGDALEAVLEAVGIERKARGENVYLVGVKLAS